MKSLHSAICLIFISLIFETAISAPVSKTSALVLAQNFLTRVGDTGNLKSGVKPSLVYIAFDQLQQAGETCMETPAFYIFNSDQAGFVIVAGDDRVSPVLAYSRESRFDADLIPDGLKALLRDYEAGVYYYRKNNLPSSSEMKKVWGQYLQEEVILKTAPVAGTVKPLTTTKWGYGKPYNVFCPAEPKAVGRNGGHCAAGCAAVAMAQLMRYWKWPKTGLGCNPSWAWDYGWQWADFARTTYEWENMPDAIDENSPLNHKDAIANLIYHCGVSVDMTYSINNSSCTFAHNPSAPVNNCVETSFVKYFRYKNTVKSIKKSFPDSTWKTIIKNEILAGRPVLYDGYDTALKASHTYIIDGYDDTDHFHVNWGTYFDYGDAYFDINLMGFSNYVFTGGDPKNGGPWILVGIEPDFNSVVDTLCSEKSLKMDEQVRIWPNPASDRLNVAFDCLVDDVENVEILNNLGMRILSVPYSCSTLQIPLEGIKDGIYFLRLKYRKNPVTQKFIIQK